MHEVNPGSSDTSTFDQARVAILIPCLNEATTISKVVNEFKAFLPMAKIYVYDNNSTDDTAERARSAGAEVKGIAKKGKSAVVMRMFSDIEADIYVLVDGDDTYDLSSVREMVGVFVAGSYDMMVGRRIALSDGAYRSGHVLGNYILTRLVSVLFGGGLDDMLSGYRIFNKNFVKSFPVQSSGFGLETELNIHSVTLNLSVIEFPVAYKERPPGSYSKLSTYRDGARILKIIARLFIFERPVFFYGLLAILSFSLGLILLIPVVDYYIDTGTVPRFPTAIASGFLFVLSLIATAAGLILDHIGRLRREVKLLRYMQSDL